MHISELRLPFAVMFSIIAALILLMVPVTVTYALLLIAGLLPVDWPSSTVIGLDVYTTLLLERSFLLRLASSAIGASVAQKQLEYWFLYRRRILWLARGHAPSWLDIVDDPVVRRVAGWWTAIAATNKSTCIHAAKSTLGFIVACFVPGCVNLLRFLLAGSVEFRGHASADATLSSSAMPGSWSPIFDEPEPSAQVSAVAVSSSLEESCRVFKTPQVPVSATSTSTCAPELPVKQTENVQSVRSCKQPSKGILKKPTLRFNEFEGAEERWTSTTMAQEDRECVYTAERAAKQCGAGAKASQTKADDDEVRRGERALGLAHSALVDVTAPPAEPSLIVSDPIVGTPEEKSLTAEFLAIASKEVATSLVSATIKSPPVACPDTQQPSTSLQLALAQSSFADQAVLHPFEGVQRAVRDAIVAAKADKQKPSTLPKRLHHGMRRVSLEVLKAKNAVVTKHSSRRVALEGEQEPQSVVSALPTSSSVVASVCGVPEPVDSPMPDAPQPSPSIDVPEQSAAQESSNSMVLLDDKLVDPTASMNELWPDAALIDCSFGSMVVDDDAAMCDATVSADNKEAMVCDDEMDWDPSLTYSCSSVKTVAAVESSELDRETRKAPSVAPVRSSVTTQPATSHEAVFDAEMSETLAADDSKPVQAPELDMETSEAPSVTPVQSRVTTQRAVKHEAAFEAEMSKALVADNAKPVQAQELDNGIPIEQRIPQEDWLAALLTAGDNVEHARIIARSRMERGLKRREIQASSELCPKAPLPPVRNVADQKRVQEHKAKLLSSSGNADDLPDYEDEEEGSAKTAKKPSMVKTRGLPFPGMVRQAGSSSSNTTQQPAETPRASSDSFLAMMCAKVEPPPLVSPKGMQCDRQKK